MWCSTLMHMLSSTERRKYVIEITLGLHKKHTHPQSLVSLTISLSLDLHSLGTWPFQVRQRDRKHILLSRDCVCTEATKKGKWKTKNVKVIQQDSQANMLPSVLNSGGITCNNKGRIKHRRQTKLLWSDRPSIIVFSSFSHNFTILQTIFKKWLSKNRHDKP